MLPPEQLTNLCGDTGSLESSETKNSRVEGNQNVDGEAHSESQVGYILRVELLLGHDVTLVFDQPILQQLVVLECVDDRN